MTTDQLAALDAAATQGEWSVRTENGDEWWFGGIGTGGMETVIKVDGKSICVTGGADNADLRFASTLVNLYRTGQLVVAPSVESLKAVILPALWSPASGPVVWDNEKRAATEASATRIASAILKSMGAKTNG